ncbi:porphobilinogen deaminase [Gemmatimonadetes bacterium T265]|nr:porphobilinogen deaminase [Gemmatimonadetes bacterium T265]
MTRALRVGTRGSKLALAQATQVVGALRARWPARAFDVQIITTQGDVRTDVPLSAIGGRGVFAAELEQALRRGDIDVAVHSGKDLPSTLAPEFALGAFPEREDPRDVVATRGPRLADLPAGAVLGTSSPRRAAEIRALRPDLDVRDVRGNVDTRLRKLDEGQYDAILLAAAGLHRLGLRHRITEYLSTDTMLPMVSQGAIAIEVRADDADALAAVAPLDHLPTRTAVTAERAFLARLGAGCTAPTGAHAVLRADGTLRLDAMIGALDPTLGHTPVRGRAEAPAADAVALGRTLAERLLADGGDVLLRVAGVRGAGTTAV